MGDDLEQGTGRKEGGEEPAGEGEPARSQDPPPVPGAAAEGVGPEADGEEDRIVWPPGLLAEILVVVLVAVLPNLFHSFASLLVPDPAVPLPLAHVYLSGLVEGIVPAALVLYLIHRSGEPPGHFGLVRPRPRDVVLAPVVWWAMVLLFGVAIAPLAERFAAPETFEALDARLRTLFPKPDAPWQYALLAAECCAIGFGEEILFRGYLIPRLSRLLGSEGAGLVVSSAIFGLSHAYQGVLGVIYTGWWGLVFGAFFLVVPRIWPLALAHAVNNFLFPFW